MFLTVSRLMKFATKPDRKELWLVIRVTLLGMGLLGLLGFVIKLSGMNIFYAKTGSNPTTPTNTAAFLIIQIIVPLIPHLFSVL